MRVYDISKIVWGWASRFWPELWTITQEGRTRGLHICTLHIAHGTLHIAHASLRIALKGTKYAKCRLKIKFCTFHNVHCPKMHNSLQWNHDNDNYETLNTRQHCCLKICGFFVEFDKYFGDPPSRNQKKIQIKIWWWDDQVCPLNTPRLSRSQCKLTLKDCRESLVVKFNKNIKFYFLVRLGFFLFEFVARKNNNGVPIVMGIVRHKNE